MDIQPSQLLFFIKKSLGGPEIPPGFTPGFSAGQVIVGFKPVNGSEMKSY